jgi:hypothetical protein
VGLSKLDSGANIYVNNLSIAQRFDLTPKPWIKQFDIRFGNNSVFKPKTTNAPEDVSKQEYRPLIAAALEDTQDDDFEDGLPDK